MCGLWGVYSSVLNKQEVEDGLFLGYLSGTRGIDSAGMAVIGRGKKNKLKTHVHREVGHIANFLSSKTTHGALAINNPMLIMGHCRAATLGAINERNAHPIEEGAILLCHNGSIGHFHNKERDESDSDSRELARRMFNKGYLEALRDTRGDAWALSWVDYRTRTLNFARNSWRPLYAMLSKSNTLYWASEYWMLNALMVKRGYRNYDEPFSAENDTKYSYELGSMRTSITKLALEIPVQSALWCIECKKFKRDCICEIKKALEDPPFTSVPLIAAPKHIFDRPTSEESFFKGYLYKGWNGACYTVPSVWAKICKGGCFNCKKNCNLRMPLYWFGSDHFVCEECYEHSDLVKNTLVKGVKVYKSELFKGGGVRP